MNIEEADSNKKKKTSCSSLPLVKRIVLSKNRAHANVVVDPCFLHYIRTGYSPQDHQKSKIPLSTVIENFRKNLSHDIYPNVNNYNSFGIFIYNVSLKWGHNVDALYDSIVETCSKLCGTVRFKALDVPDDASTTSQNSKNTPLSLKQSKKKIRQKILDEDLIPTFPGSLWTEENIDEPSDYDEDLEMTPLCMDYANINQYSTSNECFIYELVPGTKESRKLDLKSKFKTTNPMHYKYVFSSVFDVYSHIDYEDGEEGEEESVEIEPDFAIDEDELHLQEADIDQLQYSDAEQPFQNVIRETSSGLYRVNEKYLEKIAKKYYRKNGLTKLALDHLVFRETVKLAPFVRPSLGLISSENAPFPGFDRYIGPDHEEEEDEFDCFELDECDFETSSDGANSMVPNSPHPNAHSFLLDQDQFELMEEEVETTMQSPRSVPESQGADKEDECEEDDEEEEYKKEKKLSGISKSDRRWVQKYAPIVEAAVQEQPFDINEYGHKIIDILKPDDNEDPKEKTLEEIAAKVGEKSFEQVGRLLLSALNLYNTGNVDILKVDNKADHFTLKVLDNSSIPGDIDEFN